MLLFALSFNLLTDAHNHQFGDSRYTLALSENLISHGEFTLDRYNLVAPPAPDDGPRTTDFWGRSNIRAFATTPEPD